MSALTSLLVRDRIVPVSKIEEALQLQVLSGGDIDTVLLEMDVVLEDVLSAYRAAMFGLLPATRDEVMRAPRDAVIRVPKEVAKESNIVPLLLDGRALVVAAMEPFAVDQLRRLRERLGCEISVRIVTRPRVLAGLAHHYGVELSPRTRRLVDALRRRGAGIIPYVRPPSPSLLPSKAPPSFAASEPEERELGEGLAGLTAPPPARGDAGSLPRGLMLSEPSFDMRSQTEQQVEHAAAEIAASIRDQESQPAVLPPEAARLAGFEAGRAITQPPATLSPHIARATRGPISAERASELLEQAVQRDDVLFVLLRYVQQFFEFVGVFSVGKEGARGRLSHGAGLSQELMEQVVLPLEGSGLFARVARDRRALVGDLNGTDEERAAVALLGRPAGRPALVAPILLRGRAVLLVHADRDGEGLSLEDGVCVSAIAGAVKDALQRIILQNKTLTRASVRPPSGSDSGSAPAGGDSDGMVTGSSPTSESAAPPAPEPPGEVGGESSEDDPRAQAQSFEQAPELAPPPEAELTAVDLESVSRAPPGRRPSEPHDAVIFPGESGDGSQHVSDPPSREPPRARLPGVPRAAPPPPSRRESGAPPASAGSYRYVAAGGVTAEKVRHSRERPATRPPPPQRPTHPPQRVAPQQPQVSTQAPVLEAPPARASAKRLSLVTPELHQPSVIIDMGEQVNFLVQALMVAPKNEEPPQVAELLRLGESALPVLIQMFPGPLWVDAAALRAGKLPRGRDVSGVARALCTFGAKAAPYLAGKLASSDDEVAFYALLVAGEIVHPDLLDAVARRALGADGSGGALRRAALQVLRRYARLPQFATVLRALSDLSERPGKDGKRQRLALEALGELRDGRSLPTLIARLSDSNEAIAQAAHNALVQLTAQEFGPAARRWESWAEQFGAMHRIEWLIESLMHVDVNLRTLASEELKRETQQYFGYHPALPKRERELAQRKYREWWVHEGKAAFAAT
jgi:hypothetical protein